MTNIENIWRELSADLRRFILKRTSDESIADDILQDVFVKIHSRIDTLKDIRRLNGWIYQITRHAIIDYYRTKKVAAELPETITSLENSENSNEVDVLPCIEAMVERLPGKYRQAVILTTYQGLTQKEMGKKLGLSLSGAKSRAQRAREKLKDMLMECCDFELDRFGKIIDYEPKDRSSLMVDKNPSH
jgi:RNA polymerase sigma-70 factor (ECF subfamily)